VTGNNARLARPPLEAGHPYAQIAAVLPEKVSKLDSADWNAKPERLRCYVMPGIVTNRTASGLVLLALLGTYGIKQGVAQHPRAVTVQLLAINDFHGNLEPPAGADGMVNQIPAGGAEYLATHLRDAVRDNPNSILVGAGDLMGASPLISGLFHDGPAIEALNAMNLAVTSIGNHEMDHGPTELVHRIEGARYQYLAANVVRTGTRGDTILPATAVRTVGGVKIGFIGETLEGTGSLIAPQSAQGLRFLEESSVANAAAARLERDGVHAIVLLIHQGGRQRPVAGPADPNGCANFEGDIKTVVSKLSPSIKVVISAHTHEFYNCTLAGHTVTSASSYGRMFTRVNLVIDFASDTIKSVSAKNEVVTRDVTPDPVQTAIIEKYKPGAARIADQNVGSVTGEISRTKNEAGESAMGDVVADAQLASTMAPENGGAEIAFMNSGGMRTGITGPAVSYDNLYTAQPFSNQLTVHTMTGDMIRRLLEQQFKADGGVNILQVSEGFTYQYKLHATEGQHVVAGSIMLHGRAVAAADMVRVEASDFLIAGGDGFTIFHEGANPIVGQVDVDALADYFRSHSPVAPGPRNRIVRVD
jgi:5'-nucleotidase